MSDYLDIDTILAEEERVPSRFHYAARRMGFLDPSGASTDIEAGLKLDLPLWMAADLANRNLVAVDLPPGLNRQTRQDLAAGPAAVKLREKSPYFYELGARLALVSQHAEARELPRMVRKTLAGRALRQRDTAHNSLNTDISDEVDALTTFEQKTFEAGYGFAKALQEWREDKRPQRAAAAAALAVGGAARIAAADQSAAAQGGASGGAGLAADPDGKRRRR